MAADNAMQIKNITGKVGSYAISTVKFDTWLAEPAPQIVQRTKKSKGAKEIVNKIFIECINVIDDSFWIEKFNNAAIGKFPQKFTFHDGVLTYRKGAKCQQLEVSANPIEAAFACMEFFKVNGGIFSPTDEQNSAAIHNAQSTEDIKPLTWADANKKVQECILSYYVMDMKNLMVLNEKETENLRQTIKLGISNKFFGKHNIRLENNRIHSITGLLWNQEKRCFYIDPNMKPNVTRSYTRTKKTTSCIDPSQKDTIPQFETKWNKYIEALEKKIMRDEKRKKKVTITADGVIRTIGRLNIIESSSPRSYSDAPSTDATGRTDADFTDDF